MTKSSGILTSTRSTRPSTVAVASMLSLTHLRPTQTPAIARQRKAVDAVVEHLLHAGRIEHRDHGVDHRELGLVRRGRAFAGVVVAQSAPGRRRAWTCRHGWRGGRRRRCGRRPGPCRTRCRTRRRTCRRRAAPACCVPQSAVAARSSLRPGLKTMLRLLISRSRAQERAFQSGDRRAAIAGDVARGVEPGAAGRARAASASGARWPASRSGADASPRDRTCRSGWDCFSA